MQKKKRKASSAVSALTSILDLEVLEQNLFRGRSIDPGWQRVYGGQVLGQALAAAIRTVAPDRPVHSLHSYFLLGGDPQHPIVYDVERIRDGGSYTTRRVKAIQHGEVMFVMSASFQKEEDGFDHASTMPDVPPPEELVSASELMTKVIDRLPEGMRSYWRGERPIDMRPVDLKRYISREPHPPRQYIWMKTTEPLPDDPRLHACILAYASDFTLLDTALIAHGKLLFDPDVRLASLDHAMWFHRPFRADDWLLYAQDSPTATGGRGFCRGAVYARDGRLVASVAQEGMMRRRLPGAPKK
jgi:acyl-CoA thioesterase-2